MRAGERSPAGKVQGDQETSFDFCYQAALTFLNSPAPGALAGHQVSCLQPWTDVRWDCCGHQVRLSCLWAPALFSEQEEPDSATCSLGGSPGAGVKFRLSPAPRGLYAWESQAMWNGTWSLFPPTEGNCLQSLVSKIGLKVDHHSTARPKFKTGVWKIYTHI